MEDLQNKFLELTREIEKLRESTSIIIRTHLYLEFSLNETIKFAFQDSAILKERSFQFHLKIKTLQGLGVLNDTSFQNAKLINEIRNQFAHNLDPNEDSIKNKIQKLNHNLNDDEWEQMNEFEKIKSVTRKIMMDLMLYQKNELEKQKNKLT